MKSIIVASILVASSAIADTSAYMYIPNETNCTVTTTAGALGISIPVTYIDTSCMKRQKVNAGLRYCAKFKQYCADQVVMFGEQALVIQMPNEDSSFYPQGN